MENTNKIYREPYKMECNIWFDTTTKTISVPSYISEEDYKKYVEPLIKDWGYTVQYNIL